MIRYFGSWINDKGQEIKNSNDIFISVNSPVHQRSVVLIGSDINIWQKFDDHSNNVEFLDEHFSDAKKFLKFYGKLRKKKSVTTEVEDSAFPNSMKISEAVEKFKFWQGHPIDGGVYACTSLEPNHYIPIASFHDYIFKAKMNAFIEMCSNLNAKSAKVLHIEEDGKEITSNLETNVPTKGGPLDIGGNTAVNSKVLNGFRIDYTFPEPFSSLIRYNSPWLLEEPSWKTLNHVRSNRDVKNMEVEVNHNSNYGIDGNLVGKLNKIGAKLGGSYSTFKQRRLVYDVEFWPK